MYKKLIVIMMIFVDSMYGSENEFKARIDKFENLFKRYLPQEDGKKGAEFLNDFLVLFFNGTYAQVIKDTNSQPVKKAYELSTMYISLFMHKLQQEDSDEAKLILEEFLADIQQIKKEAIKKN